MDFGVWVAHELLAFGRKKLHKIDSDVAERDFFL
jgi:hypothetical protein